MTPSQFRSLALSIPEVMEGSHMDHADFRIHGKVFATLGYPDESFGMVKLSPREQRSLIKKSPAAFAPIAGAWGKSGATKVNLAKARSAEVHDALEIAHEYLLAKLKARTATNHAPGNARRA
jgi:YjbR